MSINIYFSNQKINDLVLRNSTCFDCNSDEPQWVSMNNSVFLCLNCAGNHRKLGVDVSYVRSLSMDDWDDNQIKVLEIGGNERFREFLSSYNISIDDSNKYIYSITEYYRRLLKAELKNEGEIIEKPSKEEEKLLIEMKSMSIGASFNIKPPKQIEEGEANWFELLNLVLHTLFILCSKVYNNIIKEIYCVYIRFDRNYYIERINIIVNSDIMKKIICKSENTLNKIFDQGKIFINRKRIDYTLYENDIFNETV